MKPVLPNVTLDYKLKQKAFGTHIYSKILQQDGTTTKALVIGGTSESVFELPASNVFNLAKSQLAFTYTAVNPATTLRNHVYGSCFPFIQSIQLYTRAGQYLCDLQNAHYYTRVVWQPETKMEDYMTFNSQRPSITSEVTNAGVSTYSFTWPASDTRMLQPSLAPQTRILSQVKSYTIATSAGPVSANDNYLNGLRPIIPTNPLFKDGASVNNVNESPLEPMYLYTGLINTATPDLKIKIPLGMFYNTLLSIDKDLYFGEPLLLKITWAPENKIRYTSDAGVQALLTDATHNAGTTVAVPVAVTTLANIRLYLAIEKNPSIKAEIVEGVHGKGFKMAIPWVHVYKMAWTNVADSQNTVSLRFNAGHGKYLKKIYHTIIPQAETMLTAYQLDNRGDVVVKEYYTLLNNERIQQNNIDTSELEDYMLIKDKLRGSLIQSPSQYQYNWFHLEDFNDQKPPSDKSGETVNNNQINGGLSLDMEQKWDFNISLSGSTAIPYYHYTFAITQRYLVIDNAGARIENVINENDE